MSRASFLDRCLDRWRACDAGAQLRLYVEGRVHSIDYCDLEQRCTEMVGKFEPGAPHEIVLLLLPHSVELFLLHVGVIVGGRCPAILPWPTSRIDPRKYLRNLVHQLHELGADRLITVPELANALSEILPFPVEACSLPGTGASGIFAGLVDPLESVSNPVRRLLHQPRADEVLFLQFSGGTTGHQKCVAVTAAMLESQLERLQQAVVLDRRDGVVSWLPLYHDMGLIACLWFPLWCGVASLHMAPGDWILQPELLFRFMEEYGGTYCWLPNFAFSYLARRRPALDGTYSLAHVRGWVSCSEPVRLASFDEFVAAYADWGITHRSLQTSYAMAENVFAVSHSAIGEPPRTISRSGVRRGPAGSSNTFDLADDVFVSSGRPLADMRVRIVGKDGGLRGDKEPGEVHLQTPCLFQGYVSDGGVSTEAFTADGWYATGDHGFLADGELFVTGRLKDLIIVGGQNIFPDDIEMRVNAVAGVYPGRAVAFGVDDRVLGTEAIGVVAEMTGDFDEARAADLEMEIREAIVAGISVAPRFVAVVPQRWIVKSTAGKISRKETREKFIRERL